jgi:hypothetical protein
MAACLEVGSGPSNEVTQTFDGNKQLVLAAGYTPNAQSNGVGAWADVPVGTPAILEITGPLHIHCVATFRAHTPYTMGHDGLAELDVGDGGGALFTAPAGPYTAILTIPSVSVTISKSFHAGYSYADPLTGAYNLNIGCVPVADTVEQLKSLVPQRVMAVGLRVNQMDSSTIKSTLDALAQRANHEVQVGNSDTALKAMNQIKEIVQPLAGQNPYYAILRDTLASIALLSQPPPAS